MAKRFAGAKVNWASILERFPTKEEEQLAKLAKIRKAHETFIRRVAALPEKPPAIDWTAYKNKIPAAFVDSIKQKYEAIQIPYPKSNVDDAINAKEQEMASKVTKAREDGKATIKKLEDKLAQLELLMPSEKMTIQEAIQTDPKCGVNVAYPTPTPHDDQETNRAWRIYIDRKDKGLPAERPQG
ncbi:ATP synthase subunit d, mitochondrial-like [Thrips palmi]|uniref:ATP synthase subunit d, mitochondrial n=1 Tax=Thrips palmi TaxID=161013 RepID=A0A6P8YRD9_THRPL|nr:ATP synthase subunit d, mitochondrial-like [Thrips palmi]